MTVSSLTSSAISSQAIFALNAVTREIADSTSRLSTGIRFADAGDDVGSLAISNRINSRKVSLEQAQLNNALADSMLQTAYSAASEINDILDSMNALAVEANSGSLTATERAILDLEFQELMEEIDSIASSTSFNDIKLLDGSVSGEGEVVADTTDATKASASLTFTGVFTAGNRIVINGTNFQGTDFGVGTSATDSANNLYSYLTSSTDASIMALEYTQLGNTITATARTGGSNSERITISNLNSNANLTLSGQTTVNANEVALSGGDNDGLYYGSTRVSGTINDSILTSLTQTQTEMTLTLFDNASLADNDIFFEIEDGTTANALDFTARTAAATTSTQFLIGATAEETLENLVAAMEAYSGLDDHILRQMEFEINDNILTVRSVLPGEVTELASGNGVVGVRSSLAPAVAIESTNDFTGGSVTGVNTEGVMNPDFIGDSISGFSATYVGADSITASITVGDDTYEATISDTTPGVTTTVAFVSSSGGFFTVDLAAAGASVSDQDDADDYANRLDAAFAGLTFSQSRDISSYSGVGALAGGRAVLHSDDHQESRVIDSLSVTDSGTGGGDARIEMEIDGEVFSNTSLGESVGAYEMIELQSSTTGSYIRIFNGTAGASDLSTATGAATFQSSLRQSFGLDSTATGTLDFQIGSSSEDKLSVTIGKATADALFDGASIDISTTTNAVAAQTAISDAQDELNAIIADIGANQSRLDFSYSATADAITELESAYSSLAETDVASESTNYASYVVQQQAAISVLAQTQAINSNLLDLLDD